MRTMQKNKYRVTKSSMLLEIFDVEAESEQEAIRLCEGKPGALVSQNAAWSAATTQQGSVSTTLPDGFGVYLRRIGSSTEGPEAVADRCVKAGMMWASLMVESNDGYIVSPSTTAAWASVFRDRGLLIGVWSFPGDERAASVEQSSSAARLLTDVASQISADTVMLNVEAPYKNRPAQLRALIDSTLETIPASALGAVGVVSYPVPSMHPDLDFSQFSKLDYASPMFYRTAQDPALVERGMNEWAAILKTIAPTLDGWSGSGVSGATRFAQDITTVCGSGPARVPSAVVWSEAQMDNAKREVTRERAELYGWTR